MGDHSSVDVDAVATNIVKSQERRNGAPNTVSWGNKQRKTIMKDSPIVYVSMTVHRPPEIKKAKIKIDFNKSYSTFKQCCYEYEPFSKGFEPDFFYMFVSAEYIS